MKELLFMKKKFLTITTLLCLMICLSSAFEIYAATKFDFNSTNLTYNLEKMKEVKRKIGGMGYKKSKDYPDLYAVGNKMVLGINADPKWEKNESYLYIKNNGNKNVSFLGVKIGSGYSSAARKLVNSGMRKSSVNKNVFIRGEAGILTLKIKNNKVTGWYYKLSPTG